MSEPTDREQTRRDALGWIMRPSPETRWVWTWSEANAEGALSAEWEVVKVADAAELEQAKQDRDQALERVAVLLKEKDQAERERDALKARWESDNLCGICPYRQVLQVDLAKVPALVEALREVLSDADQTYFDVNPPPYVTVARAALAAYEQEQT